VQLVRAADPVPRVRWEARQMALDLVSIPLCSSGFRVDVDCHGEQG